MITLSKALSASLSIGTLVINFLLMGCQSDTEHDKELVKNQWSTPNEKPIVNNGKVSIKAESFGSIQATIFQGQISAYTFSVDREKPQSWLTGDIHEATVYLTGVGEHRDGLIIDDQQTQKRYVLSFYDISDRLKDLPASKGETIFIKGYSTGLQRSAPSIALNQ